MSTDSSSPPTDQPSFQERLASYARSQGFDHVGICAADAVDTTRFKEWLSRGYGGEMSYLSDRMPAYDDPNLVLEGVRSIVMLTTNYQTQRPIKPPSGSGRVSRYAWGPADYHDVIHHRLKQLKRWMNEAAPGSNNRGVVDSAPLLERQMAQRAGLGWQGKHTLLINRDAGSWFFLAALLTTVELPVDAPFESDHCGTCTACLDACPTDAFPQPYVLDATRCISYLTIESRELPAPELRAGIGDWMFGCDICQDVCPWNKSSPQAESSFEPRPDSNPLELYPLFDLDDESFRARFRKTPLWRPKRAGILRNAAIVLGNQGNAAHVEPLGKGLHDDEPLVRAACAWALRQIGSDAANEALHAALEHETNASVRREIERGL